MTIPTHPLAQRIMQAQEILEAHARLTGPSKADTIKALNDLLRTPAANLDLLNADAYTDKKVAEARAALAPALERAHNKLTQLRKGYTGSMGMSIDRDLVEIETARMLAKGGV